MSFAMRVFLGALLLVAALAAPPAALANVIAGVGGLALLGAVPPVAGIMVVAPHPVPVAAQVVVVPAATHVYELADGAGIVVFKEVDGRMTSRFYRSRAEWLTSKNT